MKTAKVSVNQGHKKAPYVWFANEQMAVLTLLYKNSGIDDFPSNINPNLHGKGKTDSVFLGISNFWRDFSDSFKKN